MEMTLSTSIMTFIANAVVFIILSGVITKKVAKLPKFKESFAYLGLKFDTDSSKNIRLGIILGLIIPLLQLTVMYLVTFLISQFTDYEIFDVLKTYYASIAESPIGQTDIIGKILIALTMLLFVGVGEEIFLEVCFKRFSK